MDSLKIEGQQGDGGCGPSCACGPPRRSRRLKWGVTLAVLLAATGVLASHLHEQRAATPGAGVAFVPPATRGGSGASGGDGVAVPGENAPLWGGSIPSVAALNQRKEKCDAVFLFLPAQDGARAPAIRHQIEVAEQAIRGQGKRVEAFTLDPDSHEYAKLTRAFPAPCVLAMVRGASASMVTGEVTEASLMQGYVKASRPRTACCPTGGSNGKCSTQ